MIPLKWEPTVPLKTVTGKRIFSALYIENVLDTFINI